MTYSKYDEIASVYDTFFCNDDSLKENNQVASMLSCVSGKVYDIGCGTGLLTEIINISPSDYYGIDPSSAMLDRFIEKHSDYRHRVIQDTFENSSIDLRNYDWVISLFGSISYVEKASLKRISSSNANHFLMFYKPMYFPITYKLAGVEFSHYKYSEDELHTMFKNSIVEEFNNFIIVKSK